MNILNWKGAASEHSPPSLPPLSLTEMRSAEPESLQQSLENLQESLEKLQKSWKEFERSLKFAGTIYIAGMLIFVTARMASELKYWYESSSNVKTYHRRPKNRYDESQYNVLTLHWSNATRFLEGIWTRQMDWGSLPQEMLREIGKRMVSRLDVVSFRSVCKEWRSSLPSPIVRFPLLLPPPPNCNPKFRDMPYAISELNIYRNYMGTPLLQVDQGGIFNLSFSLSFEGDKADYEQASLLAPPVRLRTYMSLRKDKANYDPASLNKMLAFSDLSLFAKAYYPCKALDSHAIRRKREGKEFPKKLVLISSSNAEGVNPNYASMSDLSVVAHLGGEGKLKGRLALLRLGGSPENWVWDTDFCTQVFVNIATYNGRLCTLNHCGRVFVMDYNSLKFTLLCVPLSIPPELEQKSLFEARGDLYLVDFKPASKDGVEAYKLCLSPQTWLKVQGMFCESFSAAACFLL